MKFSATAILATTLLGAGASAQQHRCAAYNGPSPGPNFLNIGYTHLLDTFYHSSNRDVDATIDPHGRTFSIKNNTLRRHVVCHVNGVAGRICFWINASHSCVTTLPAQYVPASVSPGFLRTWEA
ncbi:hypothetical protein B0T11DRAFT_300305 [Plectosphaerella cucumerina]|uniref:Uncharacterized protein n=1 Tax=Plectosphaerella cucumerina TaxID=40658 RepID=A0A8K0X430_9PEZI|nr:hypothetical protein B0T11DRAFT_300305 [Plectosphaerella cucumerina]